MTVATDTLRVQPLRGRIALWADGERVYSLRPIGALARTLSLGFMLLCVHAAIVQRGLPGLSWVDAVIAAPAVVVLVTWAVEPYRRTMPPRWCPPWWREEGVYRARSVTEGDESDAWVEAAGHLLNRPRPTRVPSEVAVALVLLLWGTPSAAISTESIETLREWVLTEHAARTSHQ